jgi:hypothetical protein
LEVLVFCNIFYKKNPTFADKVSYRLYEGSGAMISSFIFLFIILFYFQKKKQQSIILFCFIFNLARKHYSLFQALLVVRQASKFSFDNNKKKLQQSSF